MKALLLDVKNGIVEEINANGLHDYYRLIGCDCIDIVNREINGKRFDIICDDEGLLKENVQISAIDIKGYPMLVGNLIITGKADAEGELTDLSESDVVFLKGNVKRIPTRNYPEGILLICNVAY